MFARTVRAQPVSAMSNPSTNSSPDDGAYHYKYVIYMFTACKLEVTMNQIEYLTVYVSGVRRPAGVLKLTGYM